MDSLAKLTSTSTVTSCAAYSRTDETEHYPLVERQSFTLLQLDPLLVETLHCVHLARIRLALSRPNEAWKYGH